MSKKSIILGLSLTAALTTAALVPSAFAEPPTGAAGTMNISETPPEKPGNEPGNGSSNVSYTGVMTITEDIATDGQTYESVNDSENVARILAKNANEIFENKKINVSY